MRGEQQLLRLGEYLVRGACRQLPEGIREERFLEWAGELPAILHDPRLRLGPWRAVRMLGYAADTLRGTIITAARSGSRIQRVRASCSLVLVLQFAALLVLMASDIWDIVQMPGNALNYLQLAWTVLLASWTISWLLRGVGRTTVLLILGACLAGAAVNGWNAAQAPGDWVNYALAAGALLPTFLILVPSLLVLFLLLLSSWRGRRQAPGRHSGARSKW
jgi:hypothetical protein